MTVPTFAQQLKRPWLSLPASGRWQQDLAPGGATVRNFVLGTVALSCDKTILCAVQQRVFFSVDRKWNIRSTVLNITWDLISSGVLRSVEWLFATTDSGQTICPICKGQTVRDECLEHAGTQFCIENGVGSDWLSEKVMLASRLIGSWRKGVGRKEVELSGYVYCYW